MCGSTGDAMSGRDESSAPFYRGSCSLRIERLSLGNIITFSHFFVSYPMQLISCRLFSSLFSFLRRARRSDDLHHIAPHPCCFFGSVCLSSLSVCRFASLSVCRIASLSICRFVSTSSATRIRYQLRGLCAVSPTACSCFLK